MTDHAIPLTAETLNALRLPALWALFAERTGEQSRCPNRAFLIRRILAAQAPVAAEVPVADDAVIKEVASQAISCDEAPPASPLADDKDDAAQALTEPTLTEPTPEERACNSEDSPRRGRRRVQVRHQVLPVRFPLDAVEQLDAARERLGLPSRMALFRRALRSFFFAHGEAAVARLLERM
jgi:hypothetical protein